ncbi:hypothetical protein VFPFJ_00066 [Purpureocillium lilacinum]|uniref:Uncharacterized protein n=1 Tax=Purpureocillium lilacinum TaxID=33203 RepID=A0A179HWU8_PURLI|nr:hypothetical protein VFPFJ_00066 [Purpureocillium lilacinum]OAQ93958.1 hypothetical protein VFPFJ_00066 [Purpureocillium lilacinum]
MSSGGGPAAAQTHTHLKSLGMGIATGLMQNRREDGVRAKGPQGPQDRALPQDTTTRDRTCIGGQKLHCFVDCYGWRVAGSSKRGGSGWPREAVVAPTPDLRPSSSSRELTRLRTSLTPGGEGGAMKLEAALVLQVFVCSDAHSYMKSAAGRCLQLGPCLVLIRRGPDGASASRCMHAGGGFMMKQAGSLSAVKNPWLRGESESAVDNLKSGVRAAVGGWGWMLAHHLQSCINTSSVCAAETLKVAGIGVPFSLVLFSA